MSFKEANKFRCTMSGGTVIGVHFTFLGWVVCSC
jgi:hypothetical protein